MKTNNIRKILLALALMTMLCVTALAADYTANTPEDFYRALATGLENQEKSITIDYQGDNLPQGTSVAFYQRHMMASLPLEEDAQLYGLNIDDGKFDRDGDKYLFHNMVYFDTAEELAAVDSQVATIVQDLDLDGLPKLTKMKIIYEYVTRNFIYDDTLSTFSAYDGLQEGSMVCQGYALLLYRMMEEAGLHGQIILGRSQDENHAWNSVEIDGKWYSLDATWDTAQEKYGMTGWDYFVKGTEDFKGHVVQEAFATDEYFRNYPQAKTSLHLPTIAVTSKGRPVGTLTIRKGTPAPLEVTMPEGYDPEDAVWTSMDTDLFTFDGNTIIGKKVGVTWFTVECATDRGVIGAQLPTTVVDLTSLSDWAKDDVTEYYLNSLLPAASCHNFTRSVRREEIACILYQFIGQTVGADSISIINKYEDINGTMDPTAILIMKALGLMNGTSETTFSPAAHITRQEAASVFVRIMEYAHDTTYEVEAGVAYGDINTIDTWALDNVAIATQLGLLKGDEAGNFNPQERITKEEFVVVLSRIYDTFGVEAAA